MSLSVPAPLRLQHLASTDSTNRVAMDAARAGAPSGLVVVADRQMAGRGRQGRTWLDAGSDSLLVSVMLRPETPLTHAWAFTFVAGLAALDVATAVDATGAWLKWPNDLWIGERKAGGVLCELASQGGRLSAVVLGVGLNLQTPSGGWPHSIAEQATSLSASANTTVPRPLALMTLCESVLKWQGTLSTQGPAALVAAVERAMQPMVGREVLAEQRGGPVRCTVLGIGQNGALQLQTEQGEVLALLAGDVHLSPPQPPRESDASGH